MTRLATVVLTALSLALAGCARQPARGPITVTDKAEGVERRVPAEWEPQAAIWMQWPQPWEGPQIAAVFVDIIEVIAEYEDVHLLVNDASDEARALEALSAVDPARLTLHRIPIDTSWMRDNGPRYVEVDGELVLQNWGFDGWGGAWGPASFYVNDDQVPNAVGELLGLPVEQVSMIHERGDLEVNGVDTAMVNWSVVSHRNPGHTQEELTAAFQEALGVSSVIWAEGFDPEDGTRGHIDGMARFVAEDTVLVGQDGGALMEEIAAQIAAQRPDLRIERLVAEEAAKFMNFLVGDGFVLVATSGDARQDQEARRALEEAFPGREVRFVNIDVLWENNGGIHCVTNDQPA